MNVKKGFVTPVLSILVFLVLGLVVYGTLWFLPNVQAKKIATSEEKTSTDTISEQDPTASWKTLTSSKYKYLISYPDNFEIQGSDKNPNEIDPTDYPRVSFADYDDGATGLRLSIWENPNNLSPEAWYLAEIARDEKDKNDCLLATPDGPCPPLTLQNVTQAQETAEFKGLPAYKTLIFGFDHLSECWLVTKHANFYQICFDAENPNDPKIEEHLKVYKQMLDSFDILP